MTDPRVPDRASPALIAALAIGAGCGALAMGMWDRDALPVAQAAVEIPREYTSAELQIACLPYMRQTATTLEEAQTRVTALEVRVRAKEAEIATLEDEMRGASDPTDDAGTRLVAARGQLTTLEEQLAAAQAEREVLLRDLQAARSELQVSQIQLAESQVELIETREAGLDQQWLGFVKDAQLEVCNAGGAFTVEACRAEVLASLTPHKQRWKTCVRSAQAVPEIRRAVRRDEVLPDVAVWLDPTERQLAPWYVLFCDPDLPERDAHRISGRATPPGGRGAVPFVDRGRTPMGHLD